MYRLFRSVDRLLIFFRTFYDKTGLTELSLEKGAKTHTYIYMVIYIRDMHIITQYNVYIERYMGEPQESYKYHNFYCVYIARLRTKSFLF